MIVTIGNQKGGCGKTTTAHNLGAALAELGYTVLLVDTDPQATLTEGCGVELADIENRSLADVLGDVHPGRRALASVLIQLSDRLSLIPADISLARSEIGLHSRYTGREMALARALATLPTAYDWTVIDSPPSLGMLSLNALTASDWVIVPTQPQPNDVRGLRLYQTTLDEIRDGRDGRPRLAGILITMWAGYRLHHEARAVMQAASLPLFQTTIGRSVRVAEAPDCGRSILEYAGCSPRAAEYRALAEEVLQRCRA